MHRGLAAARGNGLAADLYALLRKVGSAARDPERAEAAMRTHLNAVHRIILNRLMAANAA